VQVQDRLPPKSRTAIRHDKMYTVGLEAPPLLRVTVATKRLNGFFREIELLENRIFNPPRTIYFNYSTFNVSHVLHSTKNASKD
jgi:hypothetical protein